MSSWRVTAACYEADAYGRDICDVSLADGTSVNREMVRAGRASPVCVERAWRRRSLGDSGASGSSGMLGGIAPG